MSFLSRIRAIRKTTEVKNKSWTRLPYNRQSLAGVLVTAETAQTVPAVWACLRWVSQNVALPPWSVYTESTDGDMNFPPRHPIDYLIGTRPSPYWSSFQFRETLTHWALRYGNGYAEIEFDPSVNLPIGLHPLHPERCEPRFDDSDKLFVRVYQNRGFAGEYVDLPYENIFHIRGFGDGPVGVNVMAYAAESIGWSRAAQLFGASFLGNGLHFGGFITTPDGLDQDGAERLHETLNSKARGPWRANSWTLLDAGMEPKPIEVEANKAQFIETNQYLLGDIARWFGVPPHAIGDLSRSTNNNIEHQGIEAVQYCLMPWGRRFCDEANAKLFGANRPGYQTFMDFSEFLKGDMSALASFLGTGVDKGLLNRDEARHYIGFNSIPDGSGKKYTAQAQMTTLEQIGTVAAPEPSPVSPSSPSSAAEALAIAKLVRKARQYENV